MKHQDISDKESILKDPNLDAFQKELVYGTVMNLEKQGDNIRVNPNGKSYLFFDGQKGWIPTVVANILNSTGYWVPVKKKNNLANLDQGEVIKKEHRKRFSFIPGNHDGTPIDDNEAALVDAKDAVKVATEVATVATKNAEESEASRLELVNENAKLLKELEELRGQSFEEDIEKQDSIQTEEVTEIQDGE